MSVSLMSRLAGTSRVLLSGAAKSPAFKASAAISPFQTYAPLSLQPNALQKWGWEYLMQQEKLKRPLSPHLTVYEPQLTWMVSGAHRISGTVMGGVVFVGAGGLMVAPFDFTTAFEFVKAWGLPGVVTAPFKFIIAYPIVFHLLNGIRFLAFDLAKGMDTIEDVYKTGWGVVILSAIISAITVFWKKSPETNPTEKTK